MLRFFFAISICRRLLSIPKLRNSGCVYVKFRTVVYCGLRVAFVLLVFVRDESKRAEYWPPYHGVKPLTPLELNSRLSVTAPFTAPPITDAVGVVRLS